MRRQTVRSTLQNLHTFVAGRVNTRHVIQKSSGAADAPYTHSSSSSFLSGGSCESHATAWASMSPLCVVIGCYTNK